MLRFAFLLAFFVSFGSSAHEPGVEISQLRVTQPVPGQPVTAGYFEMTNPTGEDLRLVSVEANFAARVEIHESMNMDGMMRMQPRDSLELPPGGSLSFTPGGLHLMIMGLDAAQMEAAPLELTFHFAGDHSLTAEAQLVDP